MGFQNVVKTEDELRDLLGHPSVLVQNKSIDYLDNHCTNFISKSSMIFISTSNRDGKCDVSPRGDEAGFVSVIDKHHLVVPERPGNRRMDSMLNILDNPSAGIIFIIPGLKETLRVNGAACITRDPELLSRLTTQGKTPHLAIGLRVEECFIHCAKAFMRSNFWNQHYWIDELDKPNISEVLSDHVRMKEFSSQEIAQVLKESYSKRLY
jgi:PPOX class probable FMN-dependent enzyme